MVDYVIFEFCCEGYDEVEGYRYGCPGSHFYKYEDINTVEKLAERFGSNRFIGNYNMEKTEICPSQIYYLYDHEPTCCHEYTTCIFDNNKFCYIVDGLRNYDKFKANHKLILNEDDELYYKSNLIAFGITSVILEGGKVYYKKYKYDIPINILPLEFDFFKKYITIGKINRANKKRTSAMEYILNETVFKQHSTSKYIYDLQIDPNTTIYPTINMALGSLNPFFYDCDYAKSFEILQPTKTNNNTFEIPYHDTFYGFMLPNNIETPNSITFKSYDIINHFEKDEIKNIITPVLPCLVIIACRQTIRIIIEHPKTFNILAIYGFHSGSRSTLCLNDVVNKLYPTKWTYNNNCDCIISNCRICKYENIDKYKCIDLFNLST